MLSNVKQLYTITIFIPTFQRPQMLKRAVESALNQTYSDIRVVVCDNASGDETAEIISEIRDSRLSYICHEKNIGMLANYQFILSKVETEFFSLLSDDDLLFPTFCETAIRGFQQFPDIAFFAGSTVIVSKEIGFLREPLALWPREGRFLPADGLPLMIDRYPVPNTVLFRKLAKEMEIDFKNQSGWDCDFLIQLAGQFPFAISKERCGIMFNHTGSFTACQSYEVTLQSIDRLRVRVEEFEWMETNLKGAVLKALQVQLRRIAFSSILIDMKDRHTNRAKKTIQYWLRKNRWDVKFLVCSFGAMVPFIHLFLVLGYRVRKLFMHKKRAYAFDHDDYTHLS